MPRVWLWRLTQEEALSTDARDAWRCSLHADATPTPCARCGTFFCAECRAGGRCAACEARALEPGLPLEDESIQLAQRVGLSLRALILHPRAFFESAARGDRLDTPLAVLTAIGAVQAVFIVVREWPADVSPDTLRGLAIVSVLSFMTPFVRTAAMAALFHPLNLLFKPGRWFRLTFRAVTWSAVFSVLFFIPVYGPALSVLVQFVYTVIGVRSLHRSAHWIWGVLVAVALLFCFVVFYKIFQTAGAR